MAETKIGITLQGTDKASATIKQVAANLDTLGKNQATNQLQKGFQNLVNSGFRQATSSLGQVGGALSALGPLGMAAGVALAAAFKAVRIEIEASQKVMQIRADLMGDLIKQESDLAAGLERRLRIEQKIRDLSIELTGGDPVAQAKARRDSVSEEIELAQAELRRRQALAASLQEARGEFQKREEGFISRNFRTVSKTGAWNDAADKQLTVLEKQETENAERMYELQMRLTQLSYERANAEKNVSEEIEKQNQAYENLLQKKIGIEKDILKEKLTAEIDQLRQDISGEESRFADPGKLSQTFTTGSHQTSLLLDRLGGNGLNQYNSDIKSNVSGMRKKLDELVAELKGLTQRDYSAELEAIEQQMGDIRDKMTELEAI